MELGAGRQFGTWGELRLGYERLHGKTEVNIGAPASDYDFDVGRLFVRMSSDKVDSLYFPTKGHYGLAEYRASNTTLGSDTDFEQVRLGFLQVHSWNRNTLVGSLSLSSTLDNDAPIESRFKLGGFLDLSGFASDQLSGQHSGLARFVYLHRINDLQLAKAYVGASLELGNVWQDSSDVSLHNTIFAGSAFVGVDTPIGPLYLGYGRNDRSKGSLYLFLGPLFSF